MEEERKSIGYILLKGLDQCADCARPMAPGFYACPHCGSNRIETVEEHHIARKESGKKATVAAEAWLNHQLDLAVSLGQDAVRLNIWNPVAQGNLGRFFLDAGITGDEGGTPIEYLARALCLVHPTPEELIARVRNQTEYDKFEFELNTKRPFWCLTAHPAEQDIQELLSAIPDEWGSRLFLKRSERTREIWENCEPPNADVFRGILRDMHPEALQVEFVSALTKSQVWYLRSILRAWGSHATQTAFPLTEDEEKRMSAWISSGAGAVIVKNPDH